MIPLPHFGAATPYIYILLGLAILVVVFVYMKKLGIITWGSGAAAKAAPGEVPFGFDLTAKALQGGVDPVVGRAEEIDRVIHILSRRRKNNPLLIGPAGVGKTAIVEGLALKLATDDIPSNLRGKKLWVLNITDLLSGTKYRGEFEKRVTALIQRIQSMNRMIILFIDELHMLVQTKGTEGAVNFTDVLKPALARGDLQLVGATTTKEYEEFIKPDETLERRFQLVMVDEPDVEDAIQILLGVKVNYEDYHDVEIGEDAVRAAVRYSHEYIKNRRLPDKAIDLIDEASATVKVRENSAPDSAVALLHQTSYEVRCEFDECPRELMKLKQEFASLKQQEQKRNTRAQLEALRKREVDIVTQIEEIERDLTKKEGRPKVTAQEIKQIVAMWAGVPVSQLH